MRLFKNVSICLVATLMLAFSSVTYAADSGGQIITKIRVTNGGTVSIWGDTAWNNPDACSTSTVIVFTPASSEYYSEMYALLVASYLQGKTVNAKLDGCTTATTNYPLMVNVTSY